MTVNGTTHRISSEFRSWEQDQWGFTADGSAKFNQSDAFKKAFVRPEVKIDGKVDYGNGPYEFGTHGEAITGDGLYFVMEYVSATGDANMYVSDGETYIKLFTAEKLFEANGKLTAFGVTDDGFKAGGKYEQDEGGSDWGYENGVLINGNGCVIKGNESTYGRAYTFAIKYGATLAAVLGEATEYVEKEVEVALTENSKEVSGAKVEVTKAPAYAFNEKVKVTIKVTVPNGIGATVTLDDGEATQYFKDTVIEFVTDKESYPVKIEFGELPDITADIAVDEAFNGKKLTFTKEIEGKVEKVELTVTDGKISLNKMKAGEWNVTCDLLGATLQTTIGVSYLLTELDMSEFVKGDAQMNMATGEWTFHRLFKETAKLTLAEEKEGNAFVAVKLKTADDFLTYMNKPTELHFGIYMTVDGETHRISPEFRSWENWSWGISADGSGQWKQGDALKKAFVRPEVKVDGNVDYWNGPYEFGTHGEAIIGDGLYFVMEYVSATGDANMYVSDGETYVKLFTAEKLFKANGKLTAFGVTDDGFKAGDKYEQDEGGSDQGYENGGKINGNGCVIKGNESTYGRAYTFAIKYGATLAAVLGEATEYVEKGVEVALTENSEEVDGAKVEVTKEPAYAFNEKVKVTIKVTVPNGYLAKVTLDGGEEKEYRKTSTITVITDKESYPVSVTFEGLPPVTKDIAVDAAYNGTKLTFTREGETSVELTVADGKISLKDMKAGEWFVNCDLLGTTLKTPLFVTDELTEFDMSSFVASGYSVNLTDGSFSWNTGDLKQTDFNLVGETGDAYVALKLKTSGLVEFLNSIHELHFGLQMTVNGQKHEIVFGNHTWEDSLGIVVDRAGGYKNTDILKALFYTHSDKKDGDYYIDYSLKTVYGAKIETDGIYFVMKYESATGNAVIYLSDGATYARVFEGKQLFEADGTLTSFGFAYDDGAVWGFKGNLGFTSTIKYGATLNDAIGKTVTKYVSPVTVNLTENSSDITDYTVKAEIADTKNLYEDLTVTLTVPNGVKATVTVDGKKYGEYYADDVITFVAINGEYAIDVKFEVIPKITKDITVGADYNGKVLNFAKKYGEGTAELTVTDGKITFTDMLTGEWYVTCDLLGTTLKATVNITEDMTELDMASFVQGKAQMDLLTGEYKFHRFTIENANLQLAEAHEGNAYVAVKVQTADDFLTYLCKPTELHFGVSMTVNGKTVGVGPSLRSWESGSWGFKINNEENFHECEAFQNAFAHPTAGDFWNGPYEFGTHGGAIIGDGLYFVMEYVSATGDVNMYLSDGQTYVKLYTAEKLFDKNGKLTAFGVSDNVYKTGWENGENWPSTEGREYTFTLSYGATLNDAIGKTVTEYQEEE